MSLIIAVKSGDTVYMGADTQSTAGDWKVFSNQPAERKIQRMQSGLLVAHAGPVRNAQIVQAEQGLFTVPADGPLTKRYIVENIIPRLYRCYRENGLFKEESDGYPRPRIPDAYLLAWQDRLYEISGVLHVKVLEHYGIIGAGRDVVSCGVEGINDQAPIPEQILDSLRVGSAHVTSVGGPYYLIDTKHQKFSLRK